MTMTRTGSQLFKVAAFTLTYLVAALIIALIQGNLEFLFYIHPTILLLKPQCRTKPKQCRASYGEPTYY